MIILIISSLYLLVFGERVHGTQEQMMLQGGFGEA